MCVIFRCASPLVPGSEREKIKNIKRSWRDRSILRVRRKVTSRSFAKLHQVREDELKWRTDFSQSCLESYRHVTESFRGCALVCLFVWGFFCCCMSCIDSLLFLKHVRPFLSSVNKNIVGLFAIYDLQIRQFCKLSFFFSKLLLYFQYPWLIFWPYSL